MASENLANVFQRSVAIHQVVSPLASSFDLPFLFSFPPSFY